MNRCQWPIKTVNFYTFAPTGPIRNNMESFPGVMVDKQEILAVINHVIQGLGHPGFICYAVSPPYGPLDADKIIADYRNNRELSGVFLSGSDRVGCLHCHIPTEEDLRKVVLIVVNPR
jgi:hypothetical protein